MVIGGRFAGAESDAHLFADEGKAGVDLVAGAGDGVPQPGGVHLRKDELVHVEAASGGDERIA